MPYTFDPIFAVDPGNPANVAANAVVTIFAPGDTSLTPLVLTTPDGLPFENPLTTSSSGHEGAFVHESLGRVAWAGGGFTGFFTAHDSIKQEAVAARDAAIAAADNAATAATTELSERIAAGDFQGPAGRDGSNVLPTDQAVADSITTPGSPANTELYGTFDPKRAWQKRISTTSPDTGILGALLEAKAEVGPIIPGLTYDPVGRRIIEFPAGDYTVTEAYALLGRENMTGKISGLRFKGAGSNLTRIIFDPTDPAANVLMKNDFWMGLVFEDLTFLTKKAGAIFMESHSTHNAQNYRFYNVGWSGPWKWIFDLQGNDNNSEFMFVGCATSFMQDDGAFIHIGATNTSDQFLNYWFYGFKHWSTSAALIDAAKGGHFHGYGIDCSDWGMAGTAANPAYLFKLRGTSHAYGVQSLTMDALRVEAKSNNAALIYSEWGNGNVNIECDWASQVVTQTYGDIIVIDLGNNSGPIYNFHDSSLAGGIRVKYGANAYAAKHNIQVVNTQWWQRTTPSEVVTYDRTATAGNNIDPQVEFENCRGSGHDAFDADGSPVWDATISWHMGDLVKELKKRVLHIHHTQGSVTDVSTNGLKAALPVGALITAITAFAPANDTTESDGGSWTLSTLEASPSVIGTVTVAGARSSGYAVRNDLATPFLCSTREKANVSLKSSGISNYGRRSIVTIEGYW